MRALPVHGVWSTRQNTDPTRKLVDTHALRWLLMAEICHASLPSRGESSSRPRVRWWATVGQEPRVEFFPVRQSWREVGDKESGDVPPRVGASRCRNGVKAGTCVARTQVPTGPREHGQSHIMPAVIVQVRRTNHPICDSDQRCARLMDGWQPWSQSQMRCSPGALGACAAPMAWMQTPRIHKGESLALVF